MDALRDAGLTVPTPTRLRGIKLFRVPISGSEVDFGLDLPIGTRIVYVTFEIHEGPIELAGGQKKSFLVPVVACDMDASLPSEHREFAWAPAGQTIASEFELECLGVWPMPTEKPMLLALYEKKVGDDIKKQTEEWRNAQKTSNAPPDVSGELEAT